MSKTNELRQNHIDNLTSVTKIVEDALSYFDKGDPDTARFELGELLGQVRKLNDGLQAAQKQDAPTTKIF